MIVAEDLRAGGSLEARRRHRRARNSRMRNEIGRAVAGNFLRLRKARGIHEVRDAGD